MKIKPNRNTGEVVVEMKRGDESVLMASTTEPFRLKKILVPIDFSDCSKKALQYALPLAKQHGAVITLLYVAPTPSYAVGEYGAIDISAFESDMRAAGERDLAAFAAREVPGKVPADTAVRTGTPASQIVALAKSVAADLIVISTHGRTGLKYVFLGSVVEHVVRYAPCPVLIVREREHEFVEP